MNIRIKNLKFNYYLIALILLEAIYIVQVYYPLYGNQGIIASAIYSLIAMAHVKYPSKQLANLILVISLAIAIPRILVMVENRIDDRRSKSIESIEYQLSSLDQPIQATYHDCKLIPSWEGAKIAKCQDDNNKLTLAYTEQLQSYTMQKRELVSSKELARQSIQLTLADYGSLIMFIVLSIALPSVIYFILLQTSPMPEPIEMPVVTMDRKNKSNDIVSQALQLYNEGYKVNDIIKQLDGKISRSTIYKYINKNTV